MFGTNSGWHLHRRVVQRQLLNDRGSRWCVVGVLEGGGTQQEGWERDDLEVISRSAYRPSAPRSLGRVHQIPNPPAAGPGALHHDEQDQRLRNSCITTAQPDCQNADSLLTLCTICWSGRLMRQSERRDMQHAVSPWRLNAACMEKWRWRWRWERRVKSLQAFPGNGARVPSADQISQ